MPRFRAHMLWVAHKGEKVDKGQGQQVTLKAQNDFLKAFKQLSQASLTVIML